MSRTRLCRILDIFVQATRINCLMTEVQSNTTRRMLQVQPTFSEHLEMVQLGYMFGQLYFDTMRSRPGARSGQEMKEIIIQSMLELDGTVLDSHGLGLCGFTYGITSCKQCGVLRSAYPVEFTRQDYCSAYCFTIRHT